MRNESPRKTAGKGALESIVWAMSASRSHSVSFGVVWNQLIDISRYIASNNVRCAIVIQNTFALSILLRFPFHKSISNFSSATRPKFSDRNKCSFKFWNIFQRKKKRNVKSVPWSNNKLRLESGWKKFSLAFIYFNYVRMSWNLI